MIAREAGALRAVRGSSVREELQQKARRLLQQAQRLLELTDPVQAAVDA
ncbi:hypothetical protein [Streptosporangium sp. NBC_01469]|nr:hypothetical protein [Streptosporangium sp. NBC_01469]